MMDLGAAHPRKRLKTKVVSFNGLNLMFPGKPPIAIHHERNMLWHRTLA